MIDYDFHLWYEIWQRFRQVYREMLQVNLPELPWLFFNKDVVRVTIPYNTYYLPRELESIPSVELNGVLRQIIWQHWGEMQEYIEREYGEFILNRLSN